MNKRTISTLILFFGILPICLSFGQNPVKDFCQKTGVHQKSVVIALSPANCAVCYVQPDELLDKIRKTNKDIPVYVVTDEDMLATEIRIFRSKFGRYANSLTFVTDKSTFQYMLSEKQGIPSVCCVSAEGDILVFKHLKHENLDALFETIQPRFEIFLVNKTELKSRFISPKRHSGAVLLNSGLYLFHAGANVIAKYNWQGENVRNLLIDSLPVDYLQLARQIFPERLYASSEKDYRLTRPKRSRLIRPINMIKMGNDSLCLLMEITACGDTVLNNKPTQYNRSFGSLFLFDGEFNFLGVRYFSPQNEAAMVNPHMRGAYAAGCLYLGRYDTLTGQHGMAEYKLDNAVCSLKEPLMMPKTPEEKQIIPMLPSISMSNNRIYISYFKADDKGRITFMRTYKLNPDRRSFSEAFATDNYCAQLYSTKKQNYLVWTFAQDASCIVRGYNTTRKEFTDCVEPPSPTAQKDALFFVFDGYLKEYGYTE